MEKKGCEVLITASKKDVTFELLDHYGFQYVNIGSYGESIPQKAINLPLLDIRMYHRIKRSAFNPDIFLGLGSIRASHVAYFMKKPSIIFEDTEHSREQHLLYLPFASVILTPSCFRKNLGGKHIRYDSYHELAYLHPKYFKPDRAILDEMKLSDADKYIVVRFVSWKATHDIGQRGIRERVRFVTELEKYGQVLITSESKLENELEKYRIKVAPEKIHDLLYYAAMYVGEGAKMATEAAILGTPSIYISSLASTMGNFIELQQKYGLVFIYNDPDKALERAVKLLQEQNLKDKWRAKRQKLLKDKIDVTEFMVWFVENYPLSAEESKLIKSGKIRK
jgi:predicted glycosyltransferase